MQTFMPTHPSCVVARNLATGAIVCGTQEGRTDTTDREVQE